MSKEETKLCKHCRTEIPAGAKVCPNCRKKQKGGFLKWLVIVVVVLALLSAIAGGGSDDEKVKDVTQSEKAASKPENETAKKDSEKPVESKPEEKTEFYVGETAEQKGVQITLTNVTESTGNEYIKPDEGNIFLLCEFDISNNSEKDINISSIANFEAYCDDYSLNQDILGLQAPEAEGKNQLDGSVASGKKMGGIIAYQVPAEYKTMEINVSPDFWSSNDIKFIYSK